MKPNLNVKIVIAICVAMAIILTVPYIFGCAGTTTKTVASEQLEKSRFTSEKSVFVNTITDTETGVQYIFVYDGSKGGLCPLLNQDGTPYTVEVDDE